MIKVDTRENTGNAAEWFAALDKIQPMRETAAAQEVEALRTEIETLKAKARKAPREPKPKTPEQIKAAARRDRWRMVGRVLKSIGTFLHDRARDLGLAVIVIGTFVAVFQGSLSSATLFGFTGYAAVAFALMPDALMIISAAKMRGLRVAAVQRREAKISMYFSLAFSLLSNMIAALHIVAPELFSQGVLVTGTVAYHGIIVVFLWRAVETSTKTREDAPSARVIRKGRKGSGAAVPAQKRGK